MNAQLDQSCPRPLLDGRPLGVVEATVAGIARQLGGIRPGTRTADLGSGHAGIALFFADLARYLDDRAMYQLATRHCQAALTGLPALTGLGLFDGAAGVGLAAALLCDDATTEAVADYVDRLIARRLDDAPLPPDDLVSAGTYLLAAPTTTSRRAIIDRIVVEAVAALDRGPPDLPAPRSRCDHHGPAVARSVRGLIGVVARAVEQQVAVTVSRPGLERAIDGLLEAAHLGSRGWTWSTTGARPTSAWCSGEPALAALLWRAGTVADRSDWRAVARQLARSASARPFDACGIDEACLCHGAAGFGHLLHRLYQVTGEPDLGNAARRWLLTALDWEHVVPGQCFPTRADDGRWRHDPGYLTGAAGVGLALLAGLSDVVSPWDTPLQLDLAR